MNRPQLTDADLAGKGDFGKLLKTYKAMKTPFFKTAKFWFGSSAVLVASVAAVILYSNLSTGANSSPAPFINPPVAEANIKPATYIVDPAQDSNIIHASGSKLHIPANAFLDDDGKPAKGPVELNYREFKNVADVFLSGIPMTYDSAGEQFHFETAGMMEISAMQNGLPLHANPNALITVDMISDNNEDRFNTYYLDTTEKKWKYLAQKNFNEPKTSEEPVAATTAPTHAKETTVTPVEAKQQAELAQAKAEIAAIEKQKPVQPKSLNKDKHRFTIKVDANEFPEIAVYSNMKFQVEDKAYDAKKAQVLWEDVALKRIEGSTNYEINFSNAKEKYTVVATPVFDDKDLKQATRVYEEKFKEYETKLARKKADEVRIKAEMERNAKDIEAKIQAEIAEQVKRRKEYEARLGQSELVYRSFQVANFGVWNCDCPSRLPNGANVIAKLKNAQSKDNLDIQYCYLVEKGRNAMFTYYPGSLNSFKFNPDKENIVWAVTSDLKVAVIKADAFKAASKRSGQMELELNVIDKSFKTSEEAREYLEI